MQVYHFILIYLRNASHANNNLSVLNTLQIIGFITQVKTYLLVDEKSVQKSLLLIKHLKEAFTPQCPCPWMTSPPYLPVEAQLHRGPLDQIAHAQTTFPTTGHSALLQSSPPPPHLTPLPPALLLPVSVPVQSPGTPRSSDPPRRRLTSPYPRRRSSCPSPSPSRAPRPRIRRPCSAPTLQLRRPRPPPLPPAVLCPATVSDAGSTPLPQAWHALPASRRPQHRWPSRGRPCPTSCEVQCATIGAKTAANSN